MVLSFASLAFSAMLRLLVGRRRSTFAKDVELLVLRHHLCTPSAATTPSGSGSRSRLARGAHSAPSLATAARLIVTPRIELSSALFGPLEILHNRTRRHSSPAMLTPIEYEKVHSQTANAARLSHAESGKQGPDRPDQIHGVHVTAGHRSSSCRLSG
jgi:hypothetical protein